MKLPQKELASLRKELWLKQECICPVCGTEILEHEAVLDHDHDTGHIRMVLHRNCNQIEGRVKQWSKRNGKGAHPKTILSRILLYWGMDFTKNPIHPSHKTENEREVLKLKRRMKTLKTQAAKDRYAEKIKELLGD